MDTLSKQPKVTVELPCVAASRDPRTGAYQHIESVHIEFQKDVTVFFSEKEETEYFAIIPVKIKVKRV